VLDLPFPDQVLHRSRHILDRHIHVNTVLIVEIDGIDLESLERAFEALPDSLGPTVLELLSVCIMLDPELGSDRHFPTERSQCFAYEFFIRVGAVNLGSVEECDAPFDCFPYKSNHLLLVPGLTVGNAHSHAAKPESRNFQAAFS
jgi:hypothetical protein